MEVEYIYKSWSYENAICYKWAKSKYANKWKIHFSLPVPSSLESGNLWSEFDRRCSLNTLESCSSAGMSAIGTPSHTTEPYSAAKV